MSEITLEEAITRKRDIYQMAIPRIITRMCANADLEPELLHEPKDVHDINFGFKNNGCGNGRRNGSKYCQECSDKHNNL